MLAYPEDLCADGHSWNHGFATSVMPQDVQIPTVTEAKHTDIMQYAVQTD